MKLNNDQFEALTYIFERENGNTKTKFEEQIIKDSGIGDLDSTTLEKIVIDGLNNKIYKDSNERINAYWSLGKRHNKEIIPNFREWLSDEIKLKDAQAVYQILISLGNMEEDVFNPDRDGSSAFYETELNLRDAIDYLKKLRITAVKSNG
jgi:HEAT repeat protein